MGWPLALAIALLLAAGEAAAQPGQRPLAEGRQTLATQSGRYGTLAADHPATRRVQHIFEKLVRVAGRRPGVAFEAHVLDTPRIVVEALSGGLVVISRGAIDLTGGDEDALAFLLAHEVAHLARDHHALLDSLGVLAASGGAGTSSGPSAAPSEQVVRAYHAMELDADRLGVLYAALAGYRTTAAIPTLARLIERSGPDVFHPDPPARASAVRQQIAEVADHLEVFHFGLFLLGVGRSLDAARVLEHFLTLFPSREVLSAVGVAYHREALRYAPPAPFRHALVVDAITRAPGVKGSEPRPAFRQFLDRALHYYTLAVDADPTYAPALVNLAAAYLDRGERELALGHLARALRHAPELAAAYNNRGVAAASVRDWRGAEADWLVAARRDPSLTSAAFNLVALYEAHARADEARRWRERWPGPPNGSKTAVSEQLGPVVPGTSLNRFKDWLGEPGVRQIKVPLGAGQGSDLTLLVLPRRGLVMVTRANTIDAVGSLPRATVATAAAVKPGDPLGRVAAAYGRASGGDGVQAIGVLGYPARALTVFSVDGRVQALWVGRVVPAP